MKFSPVFILVLLLCIPSHSQTTFFIKYKSIVNPSVISDNLSKQKLSKSVDPNVQSLPKFSIDHFAKGILKENDVLGRIVKVTFYDEINEELLNQILSSDNDIEYIQKSVTYKLDYLPNDSLINEQWALNKIQAFQAWDITQGSDSVLMGLIDTGIDYFHPDLQNQIFINSGEAGFDIFGNDKRFNLIDDDQNGFIDDYRGWDFTDRVGFPFDSTAGDYLNWDNDPFDDQGHGTYIAGIASAQTNNVIGIAGAAPKIKLLNLRAFDPGGYGEEDDVAAAILYAVQMGCKVINMSFGDDAFSYVLRDVIRYAYSQNVVLVASAGNSGSDLPHYPSGYSEVICVGNSTEEDYVAGSSNFGSTIDLVAPGTAILTTSLNGTYTGIYGTSASAPFVSAAAALLLSTQNFNNEEVKHIIKSTTDDINSKGWDLKSGAGRLNIYKMLSISAAALIKFNFPTQDFATSEDNILINASILSPYFVKYNLEIGVGANPTNWVILIENGSNQTLNENIFNLNMSEYSDTIYTLRIVLNQSNGRKLEERVNFYVDRTPPLTQMISVLPAFYGDKSTPAAALYTNEPSIVKMYYRQLGETEFRFITLDGFTINNQFVKQLHYGFLPKDLVVQNSTYEIYFVAENLVGLKTTVKNQNNYFLIGTNFNAAFVDEYLLPYSLPGGSIFDKSLNIFSNDYTDLILRANSNPSVSSIYHFSNNSFQLLDSLNDKLVKDFGDFNNNGLTDLLTFFVRDGFIDEQISVYSTKFNQKYFNTGGKFWPIMAVDIDDNGTTEILSVESDTTIQVWNVKDNLDLMLHRTLKNFTPYGYGNNIINSPNAVIADIDNDGIKELWMVDEDGDIFSYNIEINNQFIENKVIQTEFYGSSAYLSSGDFNGDGVDDLAVLLKSIEDFDIMPYYRLVIFSLVNNELNILFDNAFIDPSSEFGNNFRKAENSIKLFDLDNDNKDELILFTFPYSYIFKYESTGSKIISYKENINSNSIFIADLNKNGIFEIAFPYSNKIEFIEFDLSSSVTVPNNLAGYSISANKIQLSWNGNDDKYLIYRGNEKSNLALLDSTTQNSIIDSTVTNNKTYYFAVQSYSGSEQKTSGLSQIIEIYSHEPSKAKTVISNSTKSLIITFSDRIKTTIENLNSFEVPGIGTPNSVSPSNQFSYLLSFNNEFIPGSYKLVINDLRDYYNSPIKTDTIEFFVNPVNEQNYFYITSFQILSPYKIKIAFNFEVDELSAKNFENYSFQPENKVTSVQIDPVDKKIIYLDLINQKPVGSIGKEYVLRIKNLLSDENSGKLRITEGAGSYIVLTSFAKDLSDVYVYPNPVKTGTGQKNVIFSNLPQRAKISIFSINGAHVIDIEENDGNGGLEFNLVDKDGNELSTGIYIYRVVQLDDKNEEGEEKLGKFAIIK